MTGAEVPGDDDAGVPLAWIATESVPVAIAAPAGALSVTVKLRADISAGQ